MKELLKPYLWVVSVLTLIAWVVIAQGSLEWLYVVANVIAGAAIAGYFPLSNRVSGSGEPDPTLESLGSVLSMLIPVGTGVAALLAISLYMWPLGMTGMSTSLAAAGTIVSGLAVLLGYSVIALMVKNMVAGLLDTEKPKRKNGDDQLIQARARLSDSGGDGELEYYIVVDGVEVVIDHATALKFGLRE